MMIFYFIYAFLLHFRFSLSLTNNYDSVIAVIEGEKLIWSVCFRDNPSPLPVVLGSQAGCHAHWAFMRLWGFNFCLYSCEVSSPPAGPSILAPFFPFLRHIFLCSPAGLKLIFLPQPLEWWDYSCVSLSGSRSTFE